MMQKIKLLLLFLVFFLVLSPHLNFVPIWDGAIYSRCLNTAVTNKFFLFNFNCVGHTSMIYVLLLSISQYLTLGKPLFLNLTNILLGFLSILAFYKILILIFRKELEKEIFLVTCLFAFFPTFLASVINLNLDFGMTAFYLLFLYALLYQKKILTVLFATATIFSKEPGVGLYLIALYFYLIFFIGRKKVGWKNKLASYLKNYYLFIPLIFFLVFVSYRLIYRQPVLWINYGVEQITQDLFSLNLGPTFQSYIATIFTVNFSWVLTLFIILFLLKKIVGRFFNFNLPKKAKINRQIVLMLFLSFFASLYLLTAYKTYSYPRYFLALCPQLIILFYISLVNLISNNKLRIVILLTVFILFFISIYKTIDPVSKSIFGTFNFGRHKLLNLTTISKECCGYGKDQLEYNLQYTFIPRLQNKIFSDIKPSSRTFFVYNDDIPSDYHSNLDSKSFKRTLKDKKVIRPRYHSSSEIIKLKNKPRIIYFLDYPTYDNSTPITNLLNYYLIKDTKKYEDHNYSIVVKTMQLKPYFSW